MSEFITETMDNRPYRYTPLGKYIVRAPGVCSGRPTFKYTRIEVGGALDRLAAGETMDEIIAGYQGKVSREALLEAIQLHEQADARSLPGKLKWESDLDEGRQPRLLGE